MSNKRTLPLVLALLAVLGGIAVFLAQMEEDDPDSETAMATTGGEPSHATGRASSRAVEPVVPTTASGRVHAGNTGLAGATVLLTPLGDREAEPIVATTTEGGDWSLDEVPSGRYALSASAPGHLPGRRAPVVLEPKTDNGGLDLELTPGGQKLYGNVADMTGGEVDGALVMVTPLTGFAGLRAQDRFATQSGEDGSYALQVPSGRMRVSVMHADYAASSEVVDVANADRELNFSLTPMAIIEGTVVREDGSTVGNAQVVYAKERRLDLPGGGNTSFMEPLGSVVADPSGHFSIRGLEPGVLSLGAYGEGVASANETIVELGFAEQQTDVEVRVASAHAVRGRVVREDDAERGIAGARVQLEARGGLPHSAVCDDEGNFVLEGVLSGGHQLTALAEGYIPSLGGTGIEVSDADLDDVVLTLDAGISVRGRVEPPEVAEVTIKIEPGRMSMGSGMALIGSSGTTSSPDGEFELAPVNPGELTLRAVAADGRAGEVSLDVGDEGAEDVVITLREKARIEGQLVDAKGKPVAAANVQLNPDSNVKTTVIVNGKDLTATTGITGEDGRFEVVGLDGGKWTIAVTDSRGQSLAWAHPEDPERPQAPIAISLGEAEKRSGVSLVVEANDGVIAGVVREADGTPVPDVWVTASAELDIPEGKAHGEEEGEESRTQMVMVVADGGSGSERASIAPVLTDDRGRFEFRSLRKARYRLEAEAGSGGARTSLEGVEVDSNVVLELAPLGGIEGRVTIDGRDAGDATVRVNGPSSRTVRLAEGKFEVPRLEPGQYTVAVNTGDGSKTESVEVKPGETASLELALDRWATVSGIVVDKEGNPVVGGMVLIGEGADGSLEISTDGSEEQNKTGKDGSFEVRCGSGPRVLVVLGAKEPKPIVVKPFQAQSGENVDLGQLTEQEGGFGAMVAAEE